MPSKKKKKKPEPSRRAVLRALRAESEIAQRDQIRRLLALPMEERMHFLRVRLPFGGSTL